VNRRTLLELSLLTVLAPPGVRSGPTRGVLASEASLDRTERLDFLFAPATGAVAGLRARRVKPPARQGRMRRWVS